MKTIQRTANYIVNCCQYQDKKDVQRLNKHLKKAIANELIKALVEINKRFTKKIIIHPNNKKLANLFITFANEKIIFPQNTTFELFNDGNSYQIVDGKRHKLVDKKTDRSKEMQEEALNWLSAFKTKHENEMFELEAQIKKMTITYQETIAPTQAELTRPKPIVLGDFLSQGWEKKLASLPHAPIHFQGRKGIKL
ncbi:MAG: hypothetical protein JSR17_01910 [Proteobacteria bacterium]|nr:hypothetical protein [Pseudomonadota bacterium]